jgi:hypothetical protein
MQLEGFAYRLVPIRSAITNQYEAGRFETEIMYDNLMNAFRYGNMNDPDVYLDDFTVRTMSIIRLRLRFIQLADELLKQGDPERAAAVIDRCLELTPNDKIPYDYTLIQMADVYYSCELNGKAEQLVSELGRITGQNLAYFIDQNRRFIMTINDDVIYNFQVLQNLIAIARNYGSNDLASSLEAEYDLYYEDYAGKIGSR